MILSYCMNYYVVNHVCLQLHVYLVIWKKIVLKICKFYFIEIISLIFFSFKVIFFGEKLKKNNSS